MTPEEYRIKKTEAGIIRSRLALHSKGHENIPDKDRIELEIELSHLEYQLEKSGASGDYEWGYD